MGVEIVFVEEVIPRSVPPYDRRGFFILFLQVKTVMNEGKLFAETAAGLVEVVSVSSVELARLPYDLAEGVYVVGTGSTGAAAAIGVSGEKK